MVENALTKRCPFCEIDREHNKIVAENTHWYAWPCNPPEKNTRLHFIFVPKRHVQSTRELTDEEILLLFGVRRSVQYNYGYKSCGTLIRDGDARLSAGTIEHLHIHDMVPDGTGRVESPFYKGADSENEGLRRAIVFERLRHLSAQLSTDDPELIATQASLTEEERALVEGRLK